MSYKFDALISILNWLEAGQPTTPGFIQQQLEVSERTCFRYMQTLEGAGFPIYFDKSRGTYRFTEGYSLRRQNLTASESLALMMAKVSLKSMHSGLEQDIQSIAEKLSAPRHGLPEHIIIATNDFAADIHDVFALINNAIVARHGLEFSYHAASTGKTTRRRVDPWYLYFGDGIWTLRGYCHTRKELRAFALDRISGLKTLPEQFDPPAIRPDKDHDGTFGRFVSGKPVQVRLVFYGAAVQAVSRKTWHQSQKSWVREDGTLEMTFTVNGILGIRPWVYRWLPLVRVEEPQELVEMVERELGEALQLQRGL